jgi:hypothetical protein
MAATRLLVQKLEEMLLLVAAPASWAHLAQYLLDLPILHWHLDQ